MVFHGPSSSTPLSGPCASSLLSFLPFFCTAETFRWRSSTVDAVNLHHSNLALKLAIKKMYFLFLRHLRENLPRAHSNVASRPFHEQVPALRIGQDFTYTGWLLQAQLSG